MMAGQGSDKWVNAAHIKKGTKGSFNQVSFSVLDAASRAADQGQHPAHQRPKGQSLSALAKKDVSMLAPFEMRAAERQSVRSHRRIVVMALLAFLVVGFIGLTTFSVVEEPENQKSRVTSLNQALSMIADADQDLVALNEALADPSSESSRAKFEELSKKLPQTRISLQRAQALATQGSGGVLDSRSKEIAKRAESAAGARMAMVDSGQLLATQIVGALTAVQKIGQAWGLMVESDTEARKASALLSEPVEQNLAKANELMGEAADKISQAVLDVEQAKEATSLDLSAYSDYVNARKEALDQAQAALSALIEKDTAGAREAQARYAKADEAAASLAGKLPQNYTEYILQSYQENAAQDIVAYTEARGAAGIADSMLREYYASLHK